LIILLIIHNFLSYIDLSNNQIKHIDKYAFNNLGNSRFLDLSGNHLIAMELSPTYISSNHFVRVSVRYNKIQSFTNTFG
jgi:Leucine-rich repeat (LRR) protein